MDRQKMIDGLKPHLSQMVEIINKINVPMEGSLFFDDQVLDVHFDLINDKAFDKALTLVEFASNKNEILEIGFNSGFSALVFLLFNQNVKVTSVDICVYPYTMPCYEYLKDIFKDRIYLIKGDSVTTIPIICETKNNFDGYFIDGGHSEEVTGADFNNIIKYAKSNVEICADDYNFPVIKNIVHQHIQSNELEVLLKNEYNVFLKVKK